jgi:hypothetical protein
MSRLINGTIVAIAAVLPWTRFALHAYRAP